MRFLVHANGPHVGTGYGVQCGLIVERLKTAGHEVAISCTYGHAGSLSQWHGIPLYPQGWLTNSDDLITGHAEHFFGGDRTDGWVITLQDVWGLMNPDLHEFNVAAWCPVDHAPCPPKVLEFFARTGAVPVAMSRFGERWLKHAGLDPTFIPLAVDTKVMRPTPTVGTQTCREVLGIPEDVFCVGMVAMNKGWARDRKGFNEAFRAFAAFQADHPDAVLYMHTDIAGVAEGFNLVELAQAAGIPQNAFIPVNQYAYRIGGFSQAMMAATYSAFDVLLSPSHGEGFCVPLIEAQACGTPVIATDFSSQTELAGPQYGAAGWLVAGQLEWDPAQHANYLVPDIGEIVEALEACYKSDRAELAAAGRKFAERYDADTVFKECWLPFLKRLEGNVEQPQLARPLMGEDADVAVIVPVLNRPHNVRPLVESFVATTDNATLYFVCDADDTAEVDEVMYWEDQHPGRVVFLKSERGTTYAQKVNTGYEHTAEPWIFVCGDDVTFTAGWIDAARALSGRFDVIGTNDSDDAGRVRNPDVAAGRHADHFFIRRSYIDQYGAALDGPGVAAPEAYRHWWVDKEIVGLAKARGVFTPCLQSVVVHNHPGYDGGARDDVYQLAQQHAEADQKTWRSRLPLIEMQRSSFVKVS